MIAEESENARLVNRVLSCTVVWHEVVRVIRVSGPPRSSDEEDAARSSINGCGAKG